MNPYFDPEVIKKAVFPKWYWVFMWVFPTYVNLGEDSVVFYKNIADHIFITKIEDAPWKAKL